MKIGAGSVVCLISLLFATQMSVGSILGKADVDAMGTITSVNVEVTPTVLNWGFVNPNSINQMTINVKNNGTVPMFLTWNVTEWTPDHAPDYMTLTWNYAGQPIIDSWQPIVLTLTVHQNVTVSNPEIRDFNMNILVHGES